MTKAQLISILAEWPDDVVIAIASDEEGNQKRKLADWDVLYTRDPDAYRLEDVEVSIDEDDEDMNPLTPVLVLYP